MKDAMKKISSERSELEVGREKIKFLEAQVKHLETENEKLKLELRLLNELGLK
jgi:predicted RNase H-like nuclease (RuvC/YqgF family)